MCIGVECGAGFWVVFCGKRSRRWDARFCIENRFPLFARFDRFRNHEPGHGANPARSPVVQLNPCTGQARGLAAEIQVRIERGTMCRERRGVSRETILNS